MDNIIKEIKLQLGQKEVSLTVEEAKKLKEALDELFNKSVVTEVPIPYPYPIWRWWYPTWGFSTADGVYRITNTACTVGYDSNTNAMTLKVA